MKEFQFLFGLYVFLSLQLSSPPPVYLRPIVLGPSSLSLILAVRLVRSTHTPTAHRPRFCSSRNPSFTPQSLAQLMPREGLTILHRTMGTDPPLLGLHGPDDSHSKQWAQAEARPG